MSLLARQWVLGLSLALGGTQAAQADLVIADWKTAGDGALMWDTVSNREWLRLEHTAGLSFNQVNARLSSDFLGFAYASADDVWELYRNAGVVPTFPAPGAPTLALLNLWGNAHSQGNGYTATYAITGTAARFEPGKLQAATVFHRTPASDTWIHHVNVGGNVQLPTYAAAWLGSALMRQHQDVAHVPEPGSLLLACVGLLALGVRRRP